MNPPETATSHQGEPAVQTAADGEGNLIVLGLLAVVVGVGSGLLGTAFRQSLDQVNQLRNRLILWGHDGRAWVVIVVILAAAAATAVAAWLVRRFSPHASGSGIPHVEAVLKQELPPAPWSLIPVKFGGGVLAIGAGLALGREGPSVQMGASLAHLIGKISRRDWGDCQALIAAGAGAGLATAFNAPIAGAVFVLEELVRCFQVRMAIAALGASAAAMAVARLFLGNGLEFAVEPLGHPSAAANILFLGLGIVAGLVAVAYNRTLMAALRVTGRLKNWPVELRALLVGGAAGALAWFAPDLVGGGELLTQRTLAWSSPVSVLAIVFLVRFALGPISYATRTPGGLFAPMLVLGAQLGLMFGIGCRWIVPNMDTPPEAFAVVGMAAFFTGVVRAPLTGIVLIIEMTAGFTVLLPMLGACFAAMLVPTLLGNEPIYDSLRERT